MVRAVVIHEKYGARGFYKGRRGAYRGTEMVSWDLGVSYIWLTQFLKVFQAIHLRYAHFSAYA